MIIILLTWILTIYGLSNIGVYGSILNGLRDKLEKWGNDKKVPLHKFFHFVREMMRCMMCLPTWIGFFFGIFIFSPTQSFIGASPWVSWLFDGALASGTTWIINSIVEWYEENRPVYQRTIKMENEEDDNNKKIF